MKSLFFLMMFLTFNVYAVDCRFSGVVSVQVQKTNILVQVKSNDGSLYWKNLGNYTFEYSRSFLSVAQQALASNNRVVMRYYPDSYECNETDYSKFPEMIRIEK